MVFNLLLVFLSVVYAESPLVDLHSHFMKEAKYSDESKLKTIANRDHGVLIKIEAQKFFAKGSTGYLFTSQLRTANGGSYPILIKASKSFELAFEQASTLAVNKTNQVRRLASEGGGNFNKKNIPIEMFILGKPAGNDSYVHPNGQIGNTLLFEAVKVCNSFFEHCKPL